MPSAMGWSPVSVYLFYTGWSLIGMYAAYLLKGAVDSIVSLNINIAVVIQRLGEHDRRISILEDPARVDPTHYRPHD